MNGWVGDNGTFNHHESDWCLWIHGYKKTINYRTSVNASHYMLLIFPTCYTIFYWNMVIFCGLWHKFVCRSYCTKQIDTFFIWQSITKVLLNSINSFEKSRHSINIKIIINAQQNCGLINYYYWCFSIVRLFFCYLTTAEMRNSIYVH